MIHALHGNFGLPSDWDAALPPGIPAKSWHLWEIRRHHPETHTLTGFATWFNNQVEALQPDPYRLLAGYSLGGRLALHVLADRPALWHRALFLSTHPGLGNEDERTSRLAHDLAWQTRCLQEPWAEVCTTWNAQPVLQGPDPAPDLLPLEPWRQEIAGAFDGWSLGRQQDPAWLQGRNSVPALWLTGAEDLKFSQLGLEICRKIPGFTPRSVARCGHRILFQQAAATAFCLNQLLAENPELTDGPVDPWI